MGNEGDGRKGGRQVMPRSDRSSLGGSITGSAVHVVFYSASSLQLTPADFLTCLSNPPVYSGNPCSIPKLPYAKSGKNN